MPTLLPMADGRRGAPLIFERIAIVGYGLIGGSLGLAIKERWPDALVIAVDRKDVIETAMRMHAADVGGDDLVLAADAQLIVLAAPVLANNEILSELANHVPAAALVTDTGSTKRDTVTAARQLPGRLQFVGGHPLAGAAVGGLEAARPDLFHGRPWVLTPDGEGNGEAIGQLRALLEGIGASVRVMTPAAHDELAALISHLPQLVATALMHVVGGGAGPDGLALAGRGLRDTTRLATSPRDVWRDILATNQDHIGHAVEEFVAVLRQLTPGAADEIAQGRIFESAGEWKRTLDRNFES